MVRYAVFMFVLVTPVVAAAGGDGRVPMREAIQACQSHLKDDEGFDNRKSYSFGSDYVAYVTKRDAALKENPGASNSDEQMLGPTIKELFPKCEALAAKFEKTWGPKPIDIDRISDALRLVEHAMRTCDYLKTRDNLASGQIEAKVAELEKWKKQAVDKHPALMKVPSADPEAGGKTYGEVLDSCVQGGKGKYSDQSATEDKAKKEMEEASRRQAAERAKKEAAERAALKVRYAKIRKKLKGDRVKVFDQKGEPDDFTGALESAPVWSYDGGTYHDADLIPCTWTYKFKGNKLVNQSKTGPGC